MKALLIEGGRYALEGEYEADGERGNAPQQWPIALAGSSLFPLAAPQPVS